MNGRKKALSHESKIRILQRRKTIAEMKREELDLKIEILKLKIPFRFHFQFNKFIVSFCIAAIVGYTTVAILLQNYTGMELSPTLTTSVFAFFGTELLGLASIKIFDTKFTNGPSCPDDSSASDDDIDAVG